MSFENVLALSVIAVVIVVVVRAKTISRTAVEESENNQRIFRSHNYRETMGHKYNSHKNLVVSKSEDTPYKIIKISVLAIINNICNDSDYDCLCENNPQLPSPFLAEVCVVV